MQGNHGGLSGVFGKLRRMGSAASKEASRRRARDTDFFAARDRSGGILADGEDRMTRFAHRVAELTPAQAKGCIDRFYGEAAESRGAALLMALRAGGAEAGRFVGELLEEGPIQEAERRLALRALPSVESAHRLVINEDLAARAYDLTRSEDADERMGGAGLLGTQETPRARERLMAMAEADADLRVRAAAVRMLGRVGDRTTLGYLRAYPAGELAGDPWGAGAVDAALWELEKKLA